MPPTLEERLTHLEEELEAVKRRLPEPIPEATNWLDRVFGSFKDDPIYDEAMKLGRDFREAQRPADEASDVPS